MTQRMQADGGSSKDGGDPTGAGKHGGSESNGGAYPNPHRGTEGKNDGNAPSDFLGHGGQSEIDYHGPGRLGKESVGQGQGDEGRDKKS